MALAKEQQNDRSNKTDEDSEEQTVTTQTESQIVFEFDNRPRFRVCEHD